MIENKGNKELIKLLNQAFNVECNDTFLYSREAELFRKKIKNGAEVAAKFEKLSNTELRHADRVAMEIINLGGSPVWDYELANDGGSLRTRLKMHLDKELYMYNCYDSLLKYDLDDNFAITLKGIREDEKEHIRLITELLKGLR